MHFPCIFPWQPLPSLPLRHFIRNKFNVPDSPFIYVAIITLFISSVTACYLLYRKQIYRAINCTALGILATLFTGAFALPQINPYIGFTAMATEANHIREEENIYHYYYYKFRGGENMDVYLHEEATKISTEDSLFNIYRKGDCMIFVKERTLRVPRHSRTGFNKPITRRSETFILSTPL